MKTLQIFLLILIIIGIGLIATQKIWVPKLVDRIIYREFKQPEVETTVSVPISITTKKITEKNFSGTVSIISGTNPLAVKMREYVGATISSFKTQADTDVPGMKEKFGVDNSTSIYEIDINSKYLKNEKTESIVTEVYTFTGGAHGSTVYKVMTADSSSGKILSISDIIKKEKQNDFTKLVKKELNNWRPDDSEAPIVFADTVGSLSFSSFENWSIDNQYLTIYFDQYAIGPGVLGAVAFPISLDKLKEFQL